ncbi:hypothetical protein LKL35_35415 [Streptomyces sp. ET3-23]|uniref:hypothetical protein n=1 Tax=Streptomyces sp. ET3-23 TaxID=2885643 RepID=UPI001D1124A4|nr:hypothetical protein [Streptomyces sp. ET3-23]MCC2280655.1 hypothetical protein [Streptomyces sp. ET3-23]
MTILSPLRTAHRRKSAVTAFLTALTAGFAALFAAVASPSATAATTVTCDYTAKVAYTPNLPFAPNLTATGYNIDSGFGDITFTNCTGDPDLQQPNSGRAQAHGQAGNPDTVTCNAVTWAKRPTANTTVDWNLVNNPSNPNTTSNLSDWTMPSLIEMLQQSKQGKGTIGTAAGNRYPGATAVWTTTNVASGLGCASGGLSSSTFSGKLTITSP